VEGDVEQVEQDPRAIGGNQWSIGIGRYADRAEMCHILVSWVADEYRALEGGRQRQADLDDRGMFQAHWHPDALECSIDDLIDLPAQE
jgi:hypothetical protein